MIFRLRTLVNFVAELPRKPLSSQPSPGSGDKAFLQAFSRLLSVYGALVLLALLLTPHRFLPAEDVVILHQYSRNLAQCGTISYYAGGPHAEDATDFGWMLLLAGAMRLGLSARWVTAAVNVASLLWLAMAICHLARVRCTTLRVLALCGAAGLLPQIVAADAGFPVLPFALLLTFLLRAYLQEDVQAAAMLALALSLFRPDGVVFAAPLLLTALFYLKAASV